MDPEPAGEYIALVVRLQTAADGTWHLYVIGADGSRSFPLAPLTLVIRLWRSGVEGILRGTIRFDGDDNWAPIQTNAQLESLIHLWLFGGGSATTST
jgi:hypothetical protein